MDLEAKELLLNKVLGSAEEHHKSSEWVTNTSWQSVSSCCQIRFHVYIRTVLFQLQFEKHIQKLLDESLTQEELHQVGGYFLSVLGRRRLVH